MTAKTVAAFPRKHIRITRTFIIFFVYETTCVVKTRANLKFLILLDNCREMNCRCQLDVQMDANLEQYHDKSSPTH